MASFNSRSDSKIDNTAIETHSLSDKKPENHDEVDVEVAVSDPILSSVDGKRVLRKIDLRLMPVVTLLYLMSYLDRGNIGNAKIEGLVDDLHMSGQHFNWTLTIFFIAYALFEVPSNLLLKKFRPSIWLPSIMVAWGIVGTLIGLVQNFPGLLVARLFLGLTEAGLYPGVVYYLTSWYAREDSQYRQALFFSAATISGSFSGLLAFAISKMDGVGNLEGWRWIFILEGIATVVIAIGAFFVIYDSYETAPFLTEEEKAWVTFKLRAAFQNTHERFSTKYLKQAFTDWQILVAMFMNMGLLGPIYSISLFLPTIIKDLGYESAVAQLLTIPIYLTAAIVSMIVAYFSDRYKQRSPFLIFFISWAMVGYIITIIASIKGIPGLVYAGVFIAACGLYTAFPGNIAWISNNISGSYKRSIGLGIHIGFGNLGGAITSNIYRAQDSPKFILGHSIALGMLGMALLVVIALRFGYMYCNRQRDEMGEKGLPITEEEVINLGDKSPKYRYIL